MGADDKSWRLASVLRSVDTNVAITGLHTRYQSRFRKSHRRLKGYSHLEWNACLSVQFVIIVSSLHERWSLYLLLSILRDQARAIFRHFLKAFL